MLIPDFSVAEQSPSSLDLTWVDGQIYINNQSVEDWLRDHDAHLADLPRIWVPRASLMSGHRLEKSVSKEVVEDEVVKNDGERQQVSELGAELGPSDGGGPEAQRNDGSDRRGGEGEAREGDLARGDREGRPDPVGGDFFGDGGTGEGTRLQEVASADALEDAPAMGTVDPVGMGSSPIDTKASQAGAATADVSHGVDEGVDMDGGVGSDGNANQKRSTDYPPNDFFISPDGVAEFESRVYGGERKKARNNIAAIRLVKYLEENHSNRHRGLSPEEQSTLSAYVGWGGLPKAFRNPATGEVDPEWEDIATELENLLSEEELKGARRSTLDAHYTAANVVSAMWDGLDAAGFSGGAIREPSMGTGLFFALQPEKMRSSSKRFGVEMDPISAQISRWLYPEASIEVRPYQDADALEGMMDVVIGNPPFGDQTVFDAAHPEWSSDAPNIHSYFFRKGLEELQPGGVMAFVVSRYFLDARESRYTGFRQRFHRDAELLAAVRLPRNAFMANAGTQVVTDILFFRKRMEPLNIDEQTEYPDWVNADGIIGQDPDSGRGVPGNRYYERHPDHVLGIPALIRGMYAENEPAVLPNKGDERALGDRIRAIVVPELANQHLVWPESRLVAEKRFEEENRLYPVTEFMKESVPVGSFFLVHADPAIARDERGFAWSGDAMEDADWQRLDERFPPRLAVRTGGYRGFAFAEDMMVQVAEKRPAKTEEEPADTESTESEADQSHDNEENENRSSPAVTMKKAFSAAEIQRIVGMVRIRDALRDLLRAQTNQHLRDADVEARRSVLNERYDAFVQKYGLLNRPVNQRAFRRDTFSGALLALEKNYLPEISAAVARRTGEDARPESAEKAAVFTQRTQYPYTMQTQAENPQDALRLSLSQFGKVDPLFIESSLKGTEWDGEDAWPRIRDALKDEIYLDIDKASQTDFWTMPSNRWPYQEKAMALSGDVLEKMTEAQRLLDRMKDLDVLEGLDEVSLLCDALSSVQPERVPLKDIGVRFGAPWVGERIYARFVEEVMGANVGVHVDYEKSLAKWSVGAAFPAENEVRWSVQGYRSPLWVLGKTLNRQPLLVTEKDRDGNIRVLEKETEIARQKSQDILNAWSKWIQSNEEVGEEIEEKYNAQFNRFVAPQYDGKHLELIGSSATITLRPHQKNAIWRGLQSGKTFFDHAVGAGKTFAAIGLVMEMRRLGRARKPMVVVPNHLVDQWRSAFLELYPSASVITPSTSDVDAKNRQMFLGKVAYGDWDAVIMPHSVFSRIPPDPYWASVVMEEEVSGFEEAIRALNETDGSDKRTIKQLERKVERIKSKIAESQSATGKKDAGLTMGDIGVDYLLVDEVQEFKNLPYITEMKNVAGLGNPEGSSKAQDLYVKARSLQKMREDGGGIVYLSGTPLSNTMAELYTWMRHFAYEELDQMGILHFDAWQNAFADVTHDYAFTMTGQYKEKAYLSVFDNLPELRTLTQQFMDTVSIADVRRMLEEEGMPDMPIPPIAGGKANIVVCQPTDAQRAYIGEEVGEEEDGTPKFNEGSILYRLDHLPKRPEKGEDNILSLSGEMSKVGLDLRAVKGRDNGQPDDENGQKLLRCADDILALYRRWDADRGTQLVFLDFSTPVFGKSGKTRKPTPSEQKILDSLSVLRQYEQHLEDFGEVDDALQQKADSAQELLESLSPQEIEDVEDKYSLSGDRWSAYDALKRILVQKGIPADEIAFIHEFEKPQEKAELFAMMRSGKKRILMGSSSKMGAGMNVQDRLVGLHHLDAPYRPLDIEQRNGRGLRQGNKLLEKYGPENFQIAVNYYVTEGAGDAGRWQILEFKKKFIDQYAERNSGVRRVEDPSAQALDPSRIKAMSSGSDILMDKTVLADLSKKMHAMESAWYSALRDLRGSIRRKEESVKSLSARVPVVKDAAQFSTKWLEDVAARQQALNEERAAAKEARKAEREAKAAKAQLSKADPVGEERDGDEWELVAEAEKPEDGETSASPDTRGPMEYFVATRLDDNGVPEMVLQKDRRMSDMGADLLKISANLLKSALSAMRRDIRGNLYKKTVAEMANVPLMKICVDGKELPLVIDDLSWRREDHRKLPESDDDFYLKVTWLDADGHPVSDFRIMDKVGLLYALDGKNGDALLREKGLGLGQKIVNSLKSVVNEPRVLLDRLSSEKDSLSAYRKEYDRLTLREDGSRAEDFHQQNRLSLIDAASSCMDMALKGGLRKSSMIDDKIETLQENLGLAGASGDGSSALQGNHARNPMVERIATNLERLRSVAPEIRYWSEHREEILDCLKDEKLDDSVFVSMLKRLQNREQESESMPYDGEQFHGKRDDTAPQDDLDD